MCTYIHTYIHMYSQPASKQGRQAGRHTNRYIHTYLLTYIRTYIHTYIHTCIHTYIHTHIQQPANKQQFRASTNSLHRAVDCTSPFSVVDLRTRAKTALTRRTQEVENPESNLVMSYYNPNSGAGEGSVVEQEKKPRLHAMLRQLPHVEVLMGR